MTRTTANNTQYTRFYSPEEYLAYLSTLNGAYTNTYNSSFFGGSWDSALSTLKTGTTKYVPDAQAIVNKMADEQLFSVSVQTLERSVVGFMEDHIAVATGQPYEMYNLVNDTQESLLSPISIYIETLISAGLSHDQCVKRGVAVMALALALNNIRPVELYTVCISKPSGSRHNAGIVCQIPTKPLDLERAAFMLCDTAYARRLAFQAMADHANMGHNSCVDPWAFGGDPTTKGYEENMRKALGLEPHDIFLHGGYSLDTLMLNDPVQWVKTMLAKHRGEDVNAS